LTLNTVAYSSKIDVGRLTSAQVLVLASKQHTC
jgi:hypothetical protein